MILRALAKSANAGRVRTRVGFSKFVARIGVGFAFDVTGNGTTSIRAGFGTSFERNFGNVTFNVIQNVPNYAVLESFHTTVTNSSLGPLGEAGPPLALPPSSLRNVNPNINTAQTQFWSLSLQHQLGHASVVEAAYSGADGVHLYDIIARNPIGGAQAYLGAPLDFSGVCQDTLSPTGACLTRQNEQYSAINVRSSGGSSSYHSANLRYQTQNIHSTGFDIIANYTWSHSLDNLSSTFADSSQGGSGYIGNLGYLDPRNPGLDWGSSDYDVPTGWCFRLYGIPRGSDKARSCSRRSPADGHCRASTPRGAERPSPCSTTPGT